jgi:hypothetical protein
MISLFSDVDAPERPCTPTLPLDMRQVIVDLKVEHPPFRPNEIATICGRVPAEVRGFIHGRAWTTERGLAEQPVIVWRCGDHLRIEHKADIYERRPPPTTIGRQERLPP